jgi:RNA polymerase sigma-70 factor, ECF subfamily
LARSSVTGREEPLEHLLERYRRSDSQAFKEFFRRTNKLVFNFLVWKLRNRAAAEEVMQEAYFRIHRYIATYDSSRNAVTWIMAIVRNAMLDHVAANRKMQTSVPIDQEELPSTEIGPDQLAEFRQLIGQLSAQLTPDEVMLLSERVLSGASHEEIADKYQITVASARQRVSRLLRRLKSAV